jgi:glucosamine--fructose-6-phosphate aminotransferase (isomerizing)
LPMQASEVLQAAGAKMAKLRRTFAGRRAIDCVGAGAALGTADEASLLIREAARIPASPSETATICTGRWNQWTQPLAS